MIHRLVIPLVQNDRGAAVSRVYHERFAVIQIFWDQKFTNSRDVSRLDLPIENRLSRDQLVIGGGIRKKERQNRLVEYYLLKISWILVSE